MCRLYLLAAAYCLMASAGAVSSQQSEKLLLVDRSAAGDVSLSREHMDFDITMKVTVTGAPDQEVKIASSGVREYRSQIVAVDQSGNATNVVRYYTAAHDTETGADGAKKKTSSLEGKSVRIKRTPTGADVTASSGTITEDDKRDVASSVKSDPARFFPSHPVAIGESWTPDAGSLNDSVGMKVRSLVAKLIETTQFGGHRCAHFQITAEMEENPGKAITMVLKLNGDGYQALDVQRPLSLQMSGPITATGKETSGGLDVTYTGSGTAKMMMNEEWMQVGGKPVTVQTPPKLTL